MIKTTYKTSYQDLDERFYAECGRRMPGFSWQENDAYTGELTLADNEEDNGRETILWVWPDGYGVQVHDEDGDVLAEESHATLPNALDAYERLTLEYDTNATRIIM